MKKFDFEIKLPDNFDEITQKQSVTDFLNEWTKLIVDEKIKNLRKLSLKKINEINAKYK